MFQPHTLAIEQVSAFAITNSGNILALGHNTAGTIELLAIENPARPQNLRTLIPTVQDGAQVRVTSMSFSADGSLLLAGYSSGIACVWLTSMGQCAKVINHCGSPVRYVACSADGKATASASQDGKILATAFIIDACSGQGVPQAGVMHQYDAVTPVHSLHFFPDHKGLFFDSHRFIHLFSTYSDSAYPLIAYGSTTNLCHPDPVSGVFWSHDACGEKFVTTYAKSGTLHVWRGDEVEEILKLDNDRNVPSWVFALWEDQVYRRIPGTGTVHTWAVDWAPDERTIVTCATVRQLHNCSRCPPKDAIPVGDVHMSDEEEPIVSTTYIAPDNSSYECLIYGTITIWDLGIVSAVKVRILRPFVVYDVAYSHSGRFVASGEAWGRICVFDARSGEMLVTTDVGKKMKVKKVRWTQVDTHIVYLTRCGCAGTWAWQS